MKSFLCVLMIVPLFTNAQQENKEQVGGGSKGIHFEQGLTWPQVSAKARAENKYLFIDCYATWCAPCKRMEKEVFSAKEVGHFMNSNFVCVRVQMDTSKTDDEFVRMWYADAGKLKEEFKVSVFPTYLFFSPNGKIVHRYLYAMPDSLFLKVASNALKPEKQFFTLLRSYENGTKEYDKMMYLANVAKTVGWDSTARLVAADFIRGYLNKVNQQGILKKEYFEFIRSFNSVLSSNDHVFKFLYKQGNRVDTFMEQVDFSQNIIYSVITREEINSRIWPDNKPIASIPDWNSITKAIRKKYNNYYTDLVVLDAQLKWYRQKKDKPNQIKYTVAKVEKYGIDTAGVGWAMFNNVAYELFFKHCNNKDTLTKMIVWMEIVNKNHPDDQANMDTYANLLYKVGRKKEAVQWEEKAVYLEIEAAKKEKREPDPTFQDVLSKMKKGIPTWDVN